MSEFITDQIKIRLEIEDTEIYDMKINSLINSSVAYLKLNKIIIDYDVASEDTENIYTIIDFIESDVSIKFERELSRTIKEDIVAQRNDILWQLKCIYDVEV